MRVNATLYDDESVAIGLRLAVDTSTNDLSPVKRNKPLAMEC